MSISQPTESGSTVVDETLLNWLDPRALTAHPANVRFDLRDLEELAESIAESGIVEPLVVVPLQDGHRIVAGHRRAAAAVLADVDVVPCWVRLDLADLEPDQLATALIENVQRDALTPIEEAHAYAQLTAFPNWSPERIAKAAGRNVRQVKHSIDATKLPKAVQAPVIGGNITLAEAAELEQFTDDPAEYHNLVEATGRPGFRHVLAQAKRERQTAQRAAAARAELENAGVTIVDKPVSFTGPALELDCLEDDDGEELNNMTHAECPGHAAYVDERAGKAVYLCRDPKAHGHQPPRWYENLTEEDAEARAAEAEARAAEEEARLLREAALESAAEVRRDFIRERIGRKGKPPAGTLRLAVEAILTSEAVTLDSPKDVAWYLGHDYLGNDDAPFDEALADEVRRSTDARLPLLLLAVAAAGAEENLVRPSRRWGYSPVFTARWLTFLAGLGYELSDVEKELLENSQDETSEAA
jgi:ParB family chromosome partitioning protein